MKNMTFRRVKDSGTGSGDIYFSSSKSDSCKSMDVPSGSSDLYNYKTLAYSGGTLPRTFKKVTDSEDALYTLTSIDDWFVVVVFLLSASEPFQPNSKAES